MPPGGRDEALDVLRSLCIALMIVSHAAHGSSLWKATYYPWVDAASGFVLVSGLVLGLVQRRVVGRGGVRPAVTRITRRVGVIYVAQIAIVFTAVLMASWRPEAHVALPQLAPYGSDAAVVLDVLTLQLSPVYLDVLPLYLVLMALAALAVPLMAAGRWREILAASAVAYVAGLVVPVSFALPHEEGLPGFFNLAAWQLLFLLALVAGWHWQEIRARVVARSTLVVAAGLLAGLTLAGAALKVLSTDGSAVDRAIEWAVEKGDFGPGRLLLSLAAFPLAYVLLSALVARLPARTCSNLAAIGRHSLDSFVILSLAIVVVPTVIDYSPSSLTAELVALGVIAAAWAWASARDRGLSTAPPRPAPASGTRP